MMAPAVFFSSIVGAVLWSTWAISVAERHAVRAANADAALHLLTGLVVIALAGSAWYLVPSAAGAWLGTFMTVRR